MQHGCDIERPADQSRRRSKLRFAYRIYCQPCSRIYPADWGDEMAKQKDNGGCGLAVICVLIIIAIGKCSGGSPTSDKGTSFTSTSPPTSTVETTIMYVASASLNCRAEPEPASRVVEKLSRGDRVEAGETRGKWAKLDRIGEGC